MSRSGLPSANRTIDATTKVPDMWEMSKHSIVPGAEGSERALASAPSAGSPALRAVGSVRSKWRGLSSVFSRAKTMSRSPAAFSNSRLPEADSISARRPSSHSRDLPSRNAQAWSTRSRYSAAVTLFGNP